MSVFCLGVRALTTPLRESTLSESQINDFLPSLYKTEAPRSKNQQKKKEKKKNRHRKTPLAGGVTVGVVGWICKR